MISFFSSWAEQIVLAVIVATIIEMILPDNKNKKYIKMVLGIYVLFNIISPIVTNKEVFSIENIDIEKYTQNTSSNVDQSSMDKRLKQIYEEELEKQIENIFKESGYTVNCSIDAELDSKKKNAGIHKITVKIKSKENESKNIEEIKNKICDQYEIEANKIVIK